MSENGKDERSDHDKFKEFWEKYALHWRCGLVGNYPNTAAMAWHKAIKLGADPEQMLRGAKIYTETIIPNTEPEFQPSAAKWLNGWAWMNYQEEPRRARKLTHEEQQAWWSLHQRPPDACWADIEFCAPPKRYH